MNNQRKQFMALITGQVLYLVFNFALPLYLVRVLSLTDYGIYAQFNMLTALFIPVFTLAISSELYYYFPRCSSTPDIKSTLVIQSLLLLILASILSVALLYLPFIRNYIDSNGMFNTSYIYLVVYIAITIPEFITTSLYVVNNNHLLSALFLPISTLIRVGSIIIGYILCPRIETIFIALIITSILKFGFTIAYVVKTALYFGRIRFSWNLLKKQIKYCIPLGFAQSLKTLGSQVDKFILLAFITPAQYAIYSIAFYGVPGLMQIYLAISQTYIPRMVKAYKDSGAISLISVYKSMISKTLSYTIPAIAIFVVLADIIITIVFSDKYIASVPYFRVYLMTFIFMSLGCGNLMRAIGKTKHIMTVYIIVGAAMIPITYFAIKHYGMKGAIVCSTMSLIIPAIGLMLLDARYINTSVFKLIPWKNILLIIVSAVAGIFIATIMKHYIGTYNIWSLLFILACSFITSMIVEIYYDVFFISRKEVLLKITLLAQKLK